MGGFISRLFGGARSDAAEGRIGANPTEERMREEQRRAEAAEAERQRAEEEQQRAEQQQRQADEDRRRAEEQQRQAEEERRRAEEQQRQAEEARRQAEEAARRAEEERIRAEEDRRRAEEQQRRAEEMMRMAEEQQRTLQELARRSEEEKQQAEQARRRAEEEARRAEEEKRRADEERLRAEEARRRAEEERRNAEEQQRRAEAESQKLEEEKRKADEDLKNAQLEQEKAEQAKEMADREAKEAKAALQEAERKLKEGIRPIIIPTPEEFAATKKRLNYREGIFHFAVAGISGSGKSSLINAFRGLENKNRRAAATGVTETTSEITRYPDLDSANPFVWYDVPGAGTLKIPDWIYFNAQGLYIFDCIIVLFDSRFTDTDIAILKNCARFRIPAYIVRSKSSQHIRNVIEDMEYDDDDDEKVVWVRARDKYIQETRESVARNLKAAELPQQRVYVVDKGTLVKVVRGKQPVEYLDELALLEDLLSEARARRVKVGMTKLPD